MFFVFWIYILILDGIEIGEFPVVDRGFLGLTVVLLFFLQYSNFDIIFLKKYIDKKPFIFSVYMAYFALWCWVVFQSFNPPASGAGVWLTFRLFEIAPISETIISLVGACHYWLFISPGPEAAVSDFEFYLEMIIRVALSFVVLAYILKFAKRKFGNIKP
jgi:hypothetical protein